MSGGKRSYSKELAWEHKKKPNRVKDRAARNKARAMVASKKGVKTTSISGDVGHKKAIGKGGRSVLANLFIQNPSNNRAFSRNKDGSMRSERSKKGK